MNSAFAAAIARLIVHRQARTIGLGTALRAKMGVTLPQVNRKKVLFAADFYREDPFCGFWVMLDKPSGANDIILKELAGVVMAHLDPMGQIAGAIGGPVASVHAAYGTATQAQTVGSMVDGSMASAVYTRWNDAWKAGTWSAAQGTGQEFTLAMDSMIMGGFMTMDVGQDATITGRCNLYKSSDELTYAMACAEKKGRDERGLNYCLELSGGSFYGTGVSYTYSSSTGKLALN